MCDVMYGWALHDIVKAEEEPVVVQVIEAKPGRTQSCCLIVIGLS